MTFYVNELFSEDEKQLCDTCSQPFWKPCRVYWSFIAPFVGGKLLHCATAFGYKNKAGADYP